VTILEAMQDEQLFGRWFRGPSWDRWRAFLAALFGLPMGGEALATYQQHTARTSPPGVAAREAYAIVGRRGGKGRMAALVAVFVACFRDYAEHLAPGERAVVMVVAADRKQARIVFRYIKAFLDLVPMLRAMVEHETRERIELRNGVDIEIVTCSYKSTRGYTLACVIAEELSFWDSEDTAEPDTEVLNALRPGLATLPGALLLGISTPYARRGALWDAYDRHFGRDDSRTLVWQADSLAMNPTMNAEVIAAAYEEDESAAGAEYGGQFRRDVETFIAREVVEAAVVAGVHELPPLPGIEYRAFTDPSGGSVDSFTLAIGHREERDGKRRAVLDCIREIKAPFSPEQAVGELAADLRRYRLRSVTGDRYAAEWCAEQFRKAGFAYEAAEMPKSELYRELLPAMNSRSVALLDSKRLTTQLLKLERKTGRGGRDSIDHPPRGRDDLANAVAGVVQNILARAANTVSVRELLL
jgi:hypothetical protein